MRRDRFVAERSAGWDELDGLLAAKRLDARSLLRLGALYRAAAADLALARRAFPGDPLIGALERRVLAGRQAVYGEEPGRRGLRHFVTTGYWRRVAERPVALLVAAVLMLAPLGFGVGWGLDDPAAALGVVPGDFREAVEADEREVAAGNLSVSERAAFSSAILTNNIRVSFLALAGGILVCLGTALVLVYNGLFIGVLGGLVGGAGQTETFLALVLPHGVLELSLIIVSAAAGLRLGWAIVEPGTLTRGQSLRREALLATQLVLGSIPWFVIAGLVEGFYTGSAPTLAPAVGVGVVLGALYWALVYFRGVRAT